MSQVHRRDLIRLHRQGRIPSLVPARVYYRVHAEDLDGRPRSAVLDTRWSPSIRFAQPSLCLTVWMSPLLNCNSNVSITGL